MAEFLALMFMSIGAILASAGAINYFWRTGLLRALGYASFFICLILAFWASGLWITDTRHSWGSLIPIFLAMMAVGWLGVKLALKLWHNYRDSQKDDNK